MRYREAIMVGMARTTTSTHHSPASTAFEHVLTLEGAEAIQAEIEQLRDEKERDISGRLRDVRAYGHVGVNDDYLAIMEEEAVLDARIASLENIMRRASIVEPGEVDPDVVAVGSTVTIEDATKSSRVRYRVVGAHERAGAGEVSAGSPVGQALLGRRAGDNVTVTLPRGTVREIRVVATEPLAAGSLTGPQPGYK